MEAQGGGIVSRPHAQRGKATADFLEAARNGESIDRWTHAICLFGAVGTGEAGCFEQMVNRARDDRIDARPGNAGRGQFDFRRQGVCEIGSGAKGGIGKPSIAEATKNPDDQQPGEGMSANRSDRARTHRPVGRSHQTLLNAYATKLLIGESDAKMPTSVMMSD